MGVIPKFLPKRKTYISNLARSSYFTSIPYKVKDGEDINNKKYMGIGSFFIEYLRSYGFSPCPYQGLVTTALGERGFSLACDNLSSMEESDKEFYNLRLDTITEFMYRRHGEN